MMPCLDKSRVVINQNDLLHKTRSFVVSDPKLEWQHTDNNNVGLVNARSQWLGK